MTLLWVSSTIRPLPGHLTLKAHSPLKPEWSYFLQVAKFHPLVGGRAHQRTRALSAADPVFPPCRPVTSPVVPFPDCPSEPLNRVWSRPPSQILLWEGSSAIKRGHYKCENHKQQNCVAFVSCNTLFFIPFSRNLKLYSSKQLKLIQMLQVTMAIWVRKYFSLDSIEIL